MNVADALGLNAGVRADGCINKGFCIIFAARVLKVVISWRRARCKDYALFAVGVDDPLLRAIAKHRLHSDLCTLLSFNNKRAGRELFGSKIKICYK